MKPIILNTEMVQAIQDNRKTVTRRVIKPQPDEGDTIVYSDDSRFSEGAYIYDSEYTEEGSTYLKSPYQKGDVLYVRETWGSYCIDDPESNAVYTMYRADYPIGAKEYHFEDEGEKITCGFPKWRPSIHMPKDAARIFLKVTDMKVERLQDITSTDAWNEGCRCECMPPLPECAGNREKFKRLWNSTIKKKDLELYGWDANPWVWVIEFVRVKLTSK